MIDALVIGSGGQDGSYLMEMLAASGQAAIGWSRSGVMLPDGHMLLPPDLGDPTGVSRLIQAHRPARIFYLAAYHHSAEDAVPDDRELLERSFAVHTHGLLAVLDAAAKHVPNARVFYAASSHLFGDPAEAPQTEATPFRPQDAYGISKQAGVGLIRYYRQRGLHVSCGILYNHESPRRPPRFLTRKIVRAAVAIKRGEAQTLRLGDLDAAVDWGYAPDYVEAMIRITDLPQGDDFIVATGKLTTVRDFATHAFAAVGLDWQPYVSVDQAILTKGQPRTPRVGNAAKLTAATGWHPTIDAPSLARLMVEHELGI